MTNGLEKLETRKTDRQSSQTRQTRRKQCWGWIVDDSESQPWSLIHMTIEFDHATDSCISTNRSSLDAWDVMYDRSMIDLRSMLYVCSI